MTKRNKQINITPLPKQFLSKFKIAPVKVEIPRFWPSVLENQNQNCLDLTLEIISTKNNYENWDNYKKQTNFVLNYSAELKKL